MIAANPTLLRWNRLSRLPFGRALYSRLIGFVVPYSGSIGAEVLALQPGRAEIRMADRRRLRNHLRSLHAVALTNLAEMTGNLALMSRQPAKGARWIVTGFDSTYLKKARGPVTASCAVDDLDWSEARDVEGRIELRDTAGDLVMIGRPRWKIGPA
jgi:acyl-coenzyme A thioesterase PaaI-like protein